VCLKDNKKHLSPNPGVQPTCPLRQLGVSFDGERIGWWHAADAEDVGRFIKE
jgi:hypothetical protein